MGRKLTDKQKAREVIKHVRHETPSGLQGITKLREVGEFIVRTECPELWTCEEVANKVLWLRSHYTIPILDAIGNLHERALRMAALMGCRSEP